MNELLERMEYAMRRGRRPHGTVRLYKRGKLLWERDNLFVNAGLTVLASLISGVTAGQIAAAVGFRSRPPVPGVSPNPPTTPPTTSNPPRPPTISPMPVGVDQRSPW